MSAIKSEVQIVSIDVPQYDSSKYPREKPKTSVVARYVEALGAGEKLPPIELEEETGDILDGYHRFRAAKECGLTEIECVFVRLNGTPPLLYAAGLNTRHGESMSDAEKREVARKIVQGNPEITNADIARELGVRPATVGEWVKDLRAAQTQSRDKLILHLSLLGWTQTEIGERVGLEQSAIAKIFQTYDAEFRNTFSVLLLQGFPLEDVALRMGITDKIALALSLQDKDDQQRMADLKIGIQPYDVWQFSGSDPRFGSDHPGRIPGQLIAHVLYFFTEPSAFVIDPMVGGGTTLDVCLAMGRRCYGFDIDDRHERPDVIPHNILQDGWHDRVKKADLIFFDPPYFSKMDSATIGDDGYIDGSISKLSRDEYMEFFEDILAEAKVKAKRGTKLAFLMSDWDDPTDKSEGIFVWDYARLIQDSGWKLIRHIQTPLSTQQIHPDIVNRFRTSKRLARLERYLLIAEA